MKLKIPTQRKMDRFDGNARLKGQVLGNWRSNCSPTFSSLVLILSLLVDKGCNWGSGAELGERVGKFPRLIAFTAQAHFLFSGRTSKHQSVLDMATRAPGPRFLDK